MKTSIPNQPRVEVVRDSQALAERVLGCFLETAAQALSERGRFTVAVSGGRTPKLFFERLGQSAAGRQLAWENIHLFWTDERYVPRDSEESNYKFVADTLLKHIPIPMTNVFGIPTASENILESVQAYEQTLRDIFHVEDELPVFDLILLGMGADGHTASLFPHTYAPFETEDLVCAVFKPGDDVNRITLTPPVLKAARQLIVVVSGTEKAATLQAVLQKKPDVTRYPIWVLWPVLDRITWLVDEEAAQRLI